MAGNDELFKAFDSLAEAIRGVSVGNAISRAQKQVEAIRADQEMNEFEKIKAQQSLARAVGGDIARFGANASMVQQAMASLAPEIPDARMSQLEATGKGTLAEATQAVQDEAEKKLQEKEDRAFERQKKLQELQFAHQERLAKLKADGKPAASLTRGESDKLYTLIDRKNSLEGLLDEFDEKGGAIGAVAGKVPDLVAGTLFGSDAVAYRSQVMQDFNEYRRIVTGAAASIPELKSLKPATITEDDTPDNFKAKAQAILKAGELVARTRLKIAQRQGKDTRGFAEEFGMDGAEEVRKDPFNVGNAPRGGTINVGPASTDAPPASGIPGLTRRAKK